LSCIFGNLNNIINMEAQYKIKANEIDMTFMEAIKKLFAEKSIIIQITEELDETEFLSRYQANQNHIIENMAAEPSKSFQGKEFEDYISKNL
jgi:hypothetical protein